MNMHFSLLNTVGEARKFDLFERNTCIGLRGTMKDDTNLLMRTHLPRPT